VFVVGRVEDDRGEGARHVDVLVVGAGPAGLSVARTTAAAGLETLVVERQRSVGEHVRTSGGTASTTVARLRTPSHLFHVVQRLRFVAPQETAVVPCPGALCVLDVREFYRWLAANAEQEGARVAVATSASEPLLEDDAVTGCVLKGPDGVSTVRARVVVDAGGYRGKISKQAGLHPGFTRFGVGAEHELVAPGVDDDEAVLIVGERYAPTGYAWSLPWGGRRVRLGVGLHHADVRDDPKQLLDRLFAEEALLDLGLEGAEVVERHFGMIPAEGVVAGRFAGDGILAVGDAAGQPTLVVGEGIRIAILAGELAGETIITALKQGRTDAAALAPYEERFRAELGRELQLGERVNRRLAANRDDARWDKRIRLLGELPPDLVVDLIQSRFDPGKILRWYARRPWKLAKSTVLAAAAVGRL
jgi:digeranylgeranylglycerophospholipid reductase